MTAEPLGSQDIRGAHGPVVQRAGDQRPVAPRVGKSNQVVETADAAAGQEDRAWRRLPDAHDQIDFQTSGGPDPCEVDHDHDAHAGVGGARGESMRRFAWQDVKARCDRIAVPEIKAERDLLTSHGRADGRQRVEGPERFESDDQMAGAQGTRVTRVVRRRDAGVQPERRDGREIAEDGVLRMAACRLCGMCIARSSSQDGVEVGDVQLGQAEPVHIRPCERQRIAVIDRGAGNRPHRNVLRANPAAGVHRSAGQQIDHANHSHPVCPLPFDLCPLT